MNESSEIVVTNSHELLACCEDVARNAVFGFDTEFIGEQSYRPQLCLIQVATPERLYLIDPIVVNDLTPFWDLVANPDQTTVVHAGREEIRMCAHQLGRPPANVFDVQIAAGLVGVGYPVSHASLVHQILKVRLVKGETLTDWSRRPLTKQQIRYAYDDVRYLLALHAKLLSRLKDMNRLEWAIEEFQSLQSRSLETDPEREPWRKLRGLGGLDRTQLAIVREIFNWREIRAGLINRPARYILRDDLIVEIARRLPENERELTVMRGVTRHDLTGLLAAIERGRTMIAENCPVPLERDSDQPQVGLLTNFLSAALGSYCMQEKLTLALATTTQEIKSIVRARLMNEEPPSGLALTRGWRAMHILPLILDLLEGRRRVRIGHLDSMAPLTIESDSQPNNR